MRRSRAVVVGTVGFWLQDKLFARRATTWKSDNELRFEAVHTFLAGRYKMARLLWRSAREQQNGGGER